MLLDLEEDLQSAEARCNLLEKQLDYMRKMVQTAETDRDTAIQRSAMVAKQAAQQTSDEIKGQLEKLSGLERDHMKLTASHSIAEVSFSCSECIDKLQYPNCKSELMNMFLIVNFSDIVLQSKIRELEDRLRDEAHQRKLVQDKTAEVVHNRFFA